MTAIAAQSDLLKTDYLRHGFFGSRGGASAGTYSSLNCGMLSGDTEADVLVNRSRVASSFGVEPTKLSTLRQVHGANVVVVDEPSSPNMRPEADGMVTNRPSIMLGILTADCAPILLYDPDNNVVGAAHAGWKGALVDIAGATIEAMVSVGAQKKSILAVIGPCIALESYEVGPEIRQSFIDTDNTFASLFINSERPEHHYFDLGAAVHRRLAQANIAEIAQIHHDTYKMAGDYFSHRRNIHRGIQEYGRQLSAIMLVDDAKP